MGRQIFKRVYLAYFGRYSFITPYFVRAFSSGYLKILYFTFSKTHFFILAINLYKTPHISLFILHYGLLKYHKKILLFIIIIFFSKTPQHWQHSKIIVTITAHGASAPSQHTVNTLAKNTPTPATLQIHHQQHTHAHTKSNIPTPNQTQINNTTPNQIQIKHSESL